MSSNPHTTKGSDELAGILDRMGYPANTDSRLCATEMLTAWADRRAATANREVLDAVERDVIGADDVLTAQESDGKCEDMSVNVTAYMKEAKNSLRGRQRAAIQKIREGLGLSKQEYGLVKVLTRAKLNKGVKSLDKDEYEW